MPRPLAARARCYQAGSDSVRGRRVLVDDLWETDSTHCRDNVGNWPTREVTAPRGAKGFDYYSLKDRAMAEAAEYGLMLWDGKSKGTVNNVVNLSRDHKPVVVYVAPTRQFRTIKTFGDLKDLLAQGDSDRVERIISELHLNDMPQRAAG